MYDECQEKSREQDVGTARWATSGTTVLNHVLKEGRTMSECSNPNRVISKISINIANKVLSCANPESIVFDINNQGVDPKNKVDQDTKA